MGDTLFYLKLAWRNLLRNKRRTFIAGTAIGIGLSTLVFTDALMVGMGDHMIHSGTASFFGEGRVRHAGFDESEATDKTIADLDEVVSKLEASPIVERFTPRVLSFAMIGSSEGSEGIEMVGVDPATEPFLSQVDEAIVEGRYLGGGAREILIGTGLADLLGVALGDRVVLTAAEAHTGDLAQELFRVSGIFHLNIKQMDRSMAFIPLERARRMLGLEGEVHEIAVKFTDPRYGREEDLPLWREVSVDGNVGEGWSRMLPQLETALGMTGYSLFVVGIVLFAVVSLGIVNTLFMSLYERMFEFGVLRAIGTRPRAVFRLILSEAAALAVVSIVLGLVISVVWVGVVMKTGIDYSGIEYAGVTFREKIYPVMKIEQFLLYPACVLVLTTLVGLYPAAYAARLTPARAMRRSF